MMLYGFPECRQLPLPSFERMFPVKLIQPHPLMLPRLAEITVHHALTDRGYKVEYEYEIDCKESVYPMRVTITGQVTVWLKVIAARSLRGRYQFNVSGLLPCSAFVVLVGISKSLVVDIWICPNRELYGRHSVAISRGGGKFNQWRMNEGIRLESVL